MDETENRGLNLRKIEQENLTGSYDLRVCVCDSTSCVRRVNERTNEPQESKRDEKRKRDRKRWSVFVWVYVWKRGRERMGENTHTRIRMSIIFVITNHVRCNRIKYMRSDYDGKRWIATAEMGWTKGDGSSSSIYTHSAPAGCFCTHICDMRDMKCYCCCCFCFCDCFRIQNKFIKANLMSSNFSNTSLYLTVCSWRFMNAHICEHMITGASVRLYACKCVVVCINQRSSVLQLVCVECLSFAKTITHKERDMLLLYFIWCCLHVYTLCTYNIRRMVCVRNTHFALLHDYPFSIHKQLVLCFVFFSCPIWNNLWDTCCLLPCALLSLSLAVRLSLHLATCWFGICARTVCLSRFLA